MRLTEIIEGDRTLTLAQLKADTALVLDMQKQLNRLRLYPGGKSLDGKYGPRTEKALFKFLEVRQLPRQINRAFAQTLLDSDLTTFRLAVAGDRAFIFQSLLEKQPTPNGETVAFRDRKITQSPFKDEIESYPDHLKEKPDETGVLFEPYPARGIRPNIEPNGLAFLHEDIKEACVCLGSFADGVMRARWLGKNALAEGEFWSTTKFIPLLNVVSQANSLSPRQDIDDCAIRAQGSTTSFKFSNLALGITSYNNIPASSNQLAAMFKRFSPLSELENWLKDITGNPQLKFKGRYGENPFINFPELFDTKNQAVLLKSAPAMDWQENQLSAYDLTRMITMLAWHHHLSPSSRLPGAQSASLASIIEAMGSDIARYADVAIEMLGLEPIIKSPVIISKVGWGRSQIRDRYELVYCAYVQFTDQRSRGVAMTLRAAKDLNNAAQELTELDTRMAAEVTEIIRQVVGKELV